MKWCDEAKAFLDANPGIDYPAAMVANAINGPESGVRRALNALYDDNEVMCLSGGRGPVTFRSLKAPSVDDWLKRAMEAEKWCREQGNHKDDRVQVAVCYHNAAQVAVAQHDILALALIDRTEELYKAIYPGLTGYDEMFAEWRATWRFEEGL